MADGAPKSMRQDERSAPDARTLRRVLAAFGIDEPASVKRLSAGAGPASKFVVGVPQTGTLFLKQRRRNESSVEGVLRRHRVLAFLVEQGLPVLEPIRTADGGSALLGERSIYELTRFVEGDPWPETASAAGEAGRTLAELHRALARFPRDGHDAFKPSTGLLAGGGPPLDSGGQHGAYFSRIAAEAFSRATDAGLPGREPQLIHGDFHPGNTRWHGDTLAAVLDFDACRTGHPIEEASLASVHFALDRRATSMSVRDPHPETGLIESFWSGYAPRGVGIGHAESTGHAIPWIAAGSLAIEASGGVDGGAFDRETADYASRVVTWLTEHADGLGTIIARAIAGSITGPESENG